MGDVDTIIEKPVAPYRSVVRKGTFWLGSSAEK